MTAVKRERVWLSRFVKDYEPDAVISDNRYGLYAPGVYSVFITHQLGIRTGMGALADGILRRLNYRFINRFNGCWVPDLPDCGEASGTAHCGLAAALSHPPVLPSIPTRYIGILSRFGNAAAPVGANAPAAVSTDLLILLSGPEPQRTLLEVRLLSQLTQYKGQTILVRGLPGKTMFSSLPHVRIFDHLPAADLEKLLRGTSLLLSRAGYSTIMDLARLGKKAILIPTPGQTEQEYLGSHLHASGQALRIEQGKFSLADALAKAAVFPFHPIETGKADLLGPAIQQLISAIQSAEPVDLG